MLTFQELSELLVLSGAFGGRLAARLLAVWNSAIAAAIWGSPEVNEAPRWRSLREDCSTCVSHKRE